MDITNLPKDTDSLPDIALYDTFDAMDSVKDTDYLNDASFNQNSNSSILENVFNEPCPEIQENPAKDTGTATDTNDKVMLPTISSFCQVN